MYISNMRQRSRIDYLSDSYICDFFEMVYVFASIRSILINDKFEKLDVLSIKMGFSILWKIKSNLSYKPNFLYNTAA
jgi:hypothetical protein